VKDGFATKEINLSQGSGRPPLIQKFKVSLVTAF
jgi:hypothetical protein